MLLGRTGRGLGSGWMSYMLNVWMDRATTADFIIAVLHPYRYDRSELR
jgi:hypothetical protein